MKDKKESQIVKIDLSNEKERQYIKVLAHLFQSLSNSNNIIDGLRPFEWRILKNTLERINIQSFSGENDEHEIDSDIRENILKKISEKFTELNLSD